MKLEIERMQTISNDLKKWLSPRRHFIEIRNNGFKTVIKKLKNLALIGLAFLPAMIIRGLRPIVLIRFSPIQSASFGHLAIDPEIYLCKKEWKVGQPKKRCLDLFYHALPNKSYVVANSQLAKMWNRSTLPVFRFSKHLDTLNRVFPGHEPYILPMDKNTDSEGIVWKSKIHISFTKAEERFGQEQLQKMGIEGPIVPFMNREAEYMKQRFLECDTSYHNYRDTSVKHYKDAIEELAQVGCFCLRMGASHAEDLPVNHPRIIDYARNFRSEFMDIFLLSKCHFFLSASCGPISVAALFRKPVAYVNVVSMLCNTYEACAPYDIMIFKKYWCKNEKRFLSAKEIVDRGMAYFNRTEQFVENDIELIENTPEEIKDLALEMHLRLKGEWQESKEDIILQNLFWSHVGLEEQRKKGVPSFRIGTLFLQKNKWLLGLK